MIRDWKKILNFLIAALDPAGPYFDVWKEKRITKDDAKLVDVIHTNSGSITEVNWSLKMIKIMLF